MFNFSVKNLFAIIAVLMIAVGIIIHMSYVDSDSTEGITDSKNTEAEANSQNMEGQTNSENLDIEPTFPPNPLFEDVEDLIISTPTFEDYLNPNSSWNLVGGQ